MKFIKNALHTVQMYVYRYMCLLSMFFLWHSPKEFCIFEWKKNRRNEQQALGYCHGAALSNCPGPKVWGGDVTWTIHGCDMSLSPWGGAICPLCAKPQHRVMPTKPGKDENWEQQPPSSTRSVFNFATEGRPDGLVSLLCSTVCADHHTLYLPWSDIEGSLSVLDSTLKWPYLTVVDSVKQHDPVGFAVEKQRPAGLDGQGGQLYPCFYSERTSPTSFLAYIDSPRSLKATIQKFCLE